MPLGPLKCTPFYYSSFPCYFAIGAGNLPYSKYYPTNGESSGKDNRTQETPGPFKNFWEA